MRIVLGSTSKTRRDILAKVFDRAQIICIDHDVQEQMVAGRGAITNERCSTKRKELIKTLVLTLGKLKGASVREKIMANPSMIDLLDLETSGDSVFIVTGDQVVVHCGRILEKPLNAKEVYEFYRGYSSKSEPISTVGSVVITDLATGTQVSDVDETEFLLGPVSDETICALLQSTWSDIDFIISSKRNEGDGGLDSQIKSSLSSAEFLLHNPNAAVFSCAGGLIVEHPSLNVEILRGSLDQIEGLGIETTRRLIQRILVNNSTETKKPTA